MALLKARFTTLALTLLITFTFAIDVCPTTESIQTGTIGFRYSICPNTDLRGGSAQVIANTATISACVTLCDQNPACLNAVYDKTNKVCHIKVKNAVLNWVVNNQFDVIKLRNTVPEGENIARCAVTETTYTGNTKTFGICRGSDFQGASASVTNNVANVNACAAICAGVAACTKAVYDHIGLVCHVKGPDPATTLIWVMNKQFSVIRLSTLPNYGSLGRWSDLIRFPVIPVAGYVVPSITDTTRLLMFSSWGVDAFGGASGRTQFVDYNFKTGAVSQRLVADTQHDMFCPGISSLEDGRILIAGGSDAAAVSFYDPASNNFVKGPNMKIARGYQTSVLTSEGKVFELGGSYSGGIGGKLGELWNPATNIWTILTGATTNSMLTVDGEGAWRTDNHAWLFAWKNATVFQAGPSKAQNWFDTKGAGGVAAAGIRSGGDAMCGVNVMYDTGKILSTGGSQSYTNSPGVAVTHITTITDANTPSTIEQVQNMAFPRGFANGVVLPDGTVLVTGGQRRSLVFTDTDGILYAELFNPVTKTWRTLAPEAVPRNYHAISILLPDARVFTGGGGLCYVGTIGGSTANCNKAVDHADGQIFEPPYLFNAAGSLATRPIITAISATVLRVGAAIQVTVTGGNAGKLVLVRIGSVTHSINSDQRRIPLVTIVSGNTYSTTIPNDSGIVIPGYWYLFVVSGSGVPSLARTVRITR